MKCIIILALATMAAAQVGVDFDAVFAYLDADKDHHLSLQEMMVYFNNADTDNNGKVTMEEYTHDLPPNQRHTPEAQGPFIFYDKQDGSVDNYLTPDDVSIIYNKLDANSNGALTLQEFKGGYAVLSVGIQAEIDALKSPVGK